MAILDSIGTGVKTGATPSVGTWTNYIIQRIRTGKVVYEGEDIDNSDGALITRLIFKRHPIITVEAVCKTAATPLTDFPEKDMCALTGASAYWVESCDVGEAKGATTVAVELHLIGIT